MSYSNLIQDGTGKGYMAQVDPSNKLAVRSVSETTYEEQGRAGNGFNINSFFVPFASTGTTETPLLYIVNSESSGIELVNFFAALGASAGIFSENPLFRVYGNPLAVTGGVTVPIANRRIGSTRVFSISAKRQDAGTPLVWTPSGTPVLYQTLTQSSRSFGAANLNLGSNAACIITLTTNLAASTVQAYAGFAGFVGI